ncbi:MAG: hypothetical protein RR315_01135 [Oscillospiraceae bacterium]
MNMQLLKQIRDSFTTVDFKMVLDEDVWNNGILKAEKGDYVAGSSKSKVRNGDLVIVSIGDSEEVLLRIYNKVYGGAILLSMDKEVNPYGIFLEEEFIIHGKFLGFGIRGC